MRPVVIRKVYEQMRSNAVISSRRRKLFVTPHLVDYCPLTK